MNHHVQARPASLPEAVDLDAELGTLRFEVAAWRTFLSSMTSKAEAPSYAALDGDVARRLAVVVAARAGHRAGTVSTARLRALIAAARGVVASARAVAEGAR